MRKIAFIVGMIFSIVVGIHSKTTYIPKYRSYMHIVTGIDTLAVMTNLDTLELSEPNGMFSLIIDHEDVTKEKVKAIKRAKRAAGWATFSAVMSGISTAFSQNSLQYLVRSTNTRIATQLAEIYNENANAEQRLQIDMWIDNTSEEELMINDMERGLTWYIRPSHNLHLQLNNPDVANLRISDIHHQHVYYAMVAAGGVVMKRAIEWEDNECWICAIMKDLDYDYPILDKYLRISKVDYSETVMTIEEFEEFKKGIKENKE